VSRVGETPVPSHSALTQIRAPVHGGWWAVYNLHSHSASMHTQRAASKFSTGPPPPPQPPTPPFLVLFAPPPPPHCHRDKPNYLTASLRRQTCPQCPRLVHIATRSPPTDEQPRATPTEPRLTGTRVPLSNDQIPGNHPIGAENAAATAAARLAADRCRASTRCRAIIFAGRAKRAAAPRTAPLTRGWGGHRPHDPSQPPTARPRP